MKKYSRLGCFLFIFGYFISSVDADPIFYEGFNYTSGQSVVGQSYTQNIGNSVNNYVAPSTLASVFPTLNSSGNQLQLNGVTTPGGNNGIYHNLTSTYNTAGNIYWFSTLLQVTGNPGQGYAGISLFTNGVEDFFFGQRNMGSTWGIEQHASSGVSSTVSVWNQSTALVVVELNGVTDIASIYVDPLSLGSIAPSNPDAVVTFNDFTFNRLRIQTGNENLAVDELRFGTSYAAVTPTTVPEPSDLILTVLTLLFSVILINRKLQLKTN